VDVPAAGVDRPEKLAGRVSVTLGPVRRQTQRQSSVLSMRSMLMFWYDTCSQR
jgi:hypothetical protein